MNEVLDQTYGELSDLLDLEDGLTDWEIGFIERMDVQRSCAFPFTPKMKAKIAEIWDRMLD